MSLTATLSQQLVAIRLSSARAAQERDVAQRAALAEMVRRATAYAVLYDSVIVPALRAKRWKGVRSDLLAAAADFQRALATVLITKPDVPAFGEALTAFQHTVTVLLVANETVLQPALEQAGIETDEVVLREAARAFDLRRRARSADQRAWQRAKSCSGS